ncbi:MAG: MATE family efflux transporter [Ruminococcaceae bacterium]|nr:MATE family efflux transporter [Oscillospiraceae bacterium]
MKEKLLRLFFGLRKAEITEEDKGRLMDFYKKLLIIAWPAALEGLLLSLINSLDTMMVGKLGSEAIAAVGLCGQPRMILLLLVQSLCVGTTAIVARRKGANNQVAAVSCLKQSLVIITGLGIFITIAGYFLAEPLLRLSGAADDTLPYALTYFRITSAVYLANCWTMCICAAMRGIGKTRITMVVNMAANLVNVFLNFCLISGRLGFPAMGIRGAALATAIGTCVGCVMAFYVVIRNDGYLSLRHAGSFRPERETMMGLIKIGSGTILESVCMRVGFLITGRMIAGVSTAAYATNQVVSQVSGLSFTLGDGVSSACVSLVGQSLGAERKDHAKLYVRVAQRISLFVSAGLILFMFFGRNFLPTLFSEEQAIIQGAALGFLVLIFGIYHQNMRVVLSGALRGAGDVKYVALVSLVSVAVLRPLTTWLFCYPLNALFPALQLGFTGPWLSFVLDSFVRAGMLSYRVKKGNWVNIRV